MAVQMHRHNAAALPAARSSFFLTASPCVGVQLALRPAPPAKLLILDVNQLLLHRVHLADLAKYNIPGHAVADKRFAVWARPFAREFLEYASPPWLSPLPARLTRRALLHLPHSFASQHFTVLLWSSARRANIEPCLRAVLPDYTAHVHALWDQALCAPSGKHPSERKPLLTKPLTRAWQAYGTRFGPTNTLLVDDDVHKVPGHGAVPSLPRRNADANARAQARGNPPGSAIHPAPWTCEMTDDTVLDPVHGTLAAYLRRVAAAPDVQASVWADPFAGGDAAHDGALGGGGSSGDESPASG